MQDEVTIDYNSVKRVEEIKYFGKNFNKPTFYSGRNLEQSEVRECFLSFGAEYFDF
jgi:hypothetical protein